MHLISSRFLVTLLFVLSSDAVLAQDGAVAHRLDELMAKSGLDKQLARVAPDLNTGIEQQQTNPQEGDNAILLSRDELMRLKKAVDKAFHADRLRQSCRKAFGETLSAADQEKVLEWLNTDLGKRITAIEERGVMDSSPEGIAQRERAVKAFVAAATPGRIDLGKRLAEATMAGEAVANMMINMTVGIAYGVALSTPPQDTSHVLEFRKRIEAQKPQAVAALGERIAADFAYDYRSLSEDEFWRYVVFAESPAGRRYHRVSIQGIEKAFAQGSLELGMALGTIAPKRDRSRT